MGQAEKGWLFFFGIVVIVLLVVVISEGLPLRIIPSDTFTKVQIEEAFRVRDDHLWATEKKVALMEKRMIPKIIKRPSPTPTISLEEYKCKKLLEKK